MIEQLNTDKVTIAITIKCIQEYLRKCAEIHRFFGSLIITDFRIPVKKLMQELTANCKVGIFRSRKISI